MSGDDEHYSECTHATVHRVENSATQWRCEACGELFVQAFRLDSCVQFRERPESKEWQADFGDHHAVGDTKGQALIRLGMYIDRVVEKVVPFERPPPPSGVCMLCGINHNGEPCPNIGRV